VILRLHFHINNPRIRYSGRYSKVVTIPESRLSRALLHETDSRIDNNISTSSYCRTGGCHFPFLPAMGHSEVDVAIIGAGMLCSSIQKSTYGKPRLNWWLRIGWYRLCPILPRYTPRVSDHDPREGWVCWWGMECRYEAPVHQHHRGGADLTDLITC